MVRFSRSLDLTNDFREPYDSGSTLGALFSVDDYDYVDRHTAVGGLTGFLNHRRTVRVRRQVDGRVTKSSDGGAWTQLPAPNNSLNSVGKGQWEVELKPGQRRLLTVEYERFVQVR